MTQEKIIRDFFHLTYMFRIVDEWIEPRWIFRLRVLETKIPFDKNVSRLKKNHTRLFHLTYMFRIADEWVEPRWMGQRRITT